MPGSSRALITTITVASAITLLVYGILQIFSEHDTMWDLPRFHFYVISATLLFATISALAIGWTGIRLRDMNVLFLALAIISLTGFFLIHGLTTPGFIINDQHHLAGVASQIAMTACAIWIALSTLPSGHALVRYVSKRRRTFIIGWMSIILLMNILAIARPGISDFIPIDIRPLNFCVGFLTVVVYLWTAWRYYQQFRIVKFPLQAAIVFGAVMLAITECVMVTTMMWTLAWWWYHFVLVISTLAMLYGVIAQYKSNVSVIRTFNQENDSSSRIRIGISSSMQNLIAATEAKDAYTAGHNYRVAMYGLQIAQAMNLDAEMLQALTRGGLIHDVGKIQVPGEILNKPGRLTSDERLVIEHHPLTGYEMCSYIGLMNEELSVIRHHHEKWDGTGYPDKLQGPAIPLLARILAIADVYDALTSRRSYREPWSQERAMQVIVEDSGTHFDPDCVSSFVRLCSSGKLNIPAS